MLNDFLLSFFLVVPSYVAVIVAKDQAHVLSRNILFYGGLIASVLVTLALLPALLCGGGIYYNYGSCIGGAGLADLFNASAPVIRLILLTYVLVAPVLAISCFILNWTVKSEYSPV